MGKRLGFLFIFTTLLSAAVPVMAQPEVDTHWMLDFRGGWCNSQLTGSERLSAGDSRNGLAFELSAELVLNKNVSWEFGLGVKQKGESGMFNSSASQNPGSPDEDLDFTGDVDLGYLTFDIIVNAGMPVGYSGWAGLFGGIGLGNLVNAQAVGTLNGQDADLDLEGVFKGQDFYGILGASYKYRFNNNVQLLIDYRAEIGLVDIDDTALQSGTYTFANIFMIGVGIPILVPDDES